jgi:hypothetical protein
MRIVYHAQSSINSIAFNQQCQFDQLYTNFLLSHDFLICFIGFCIARPVRWLKVSGDKGASRSATLFTVFGHTHVSQNLPLLHRRLWHMGLDLCHDCKATALRRPKMTMPLDDITSKCGFPTRSALSEHTDC